MVNNIEEMKNVKLLNLDFQAWKSVSIFIYFILFQIAILMQLPFIQVDFIFDFYLASSVLFAHELFLFKHKIRPQLISFIVELTVFALLAGLHPVLISFNLIVILFLLFIAGLLLSQRDNIFLLVYISIFFSLMNLVYFRWEGLQNLFSLVLFNFSFILVNYLSQHSKNEILFLQNEISLAQKKIRSQEEFSHILMQEMPSGLTAIDESGRMIYKNSSITKDLSLHEVDISNIHKIVQDRKQAEIHYFNTNLNQKKIYEVSSAEYNDIFLKSKVHLLLIKDVTEVKNLQDEVKHKEKLAAIGQLAAGIAHEIRNPLAGISGSIQLLSNETKNDDDLKLMRIIHKEIDRLNNLITEFLEYSKPENRPDQKVDLAFILNEVLQNIKLSPQTPKNIQFNTQISSCFIYGYSDKLKQVFLNIMMNGIQAMSELAQPILNITTQSTSDHVIISIKDNGVGMNEQTKQRIFEPFFTTKSKGTGLGLAITHKVLDSHSAKIKIESELGHGTNFTIIFNKA